MNPGYSQTEPVSTIQFACIRVKGETDLTTLYTLLSNHHNHNLKCCTRELSQYSSYVFESYLCGRHSIIHCVCGRYYRFWPTCLRLPPLPYYALQTGNALTSLVPSSKQSDHGKKVYICLRDKVHPSTLCRKKMSLKKRDQNKERTCSCAIFPLNKKKRLLICYRS